MYLTGGEVHSQTLAYHYKKPDEDFIVLLMRRITPIYIYIYIYIYIGVRNATDFQLEKLEINGNLGYDSRPSMSITLKLQGSNQNNRI